MIAATPNPYTKNSKETFHNKKFEFDVKADKLFLGYFGCTNNYRWLWDSFIRWMTTHSNRKKMHNQCTLFWIPIFCLFFHKLTSTAIQRGSEMSWIWIEQKGIQSNPPHKLVTSEQNHSAKKVKIKDRSKRISGHNSRQYIYMTRKYKIEEAWWDLAYDQLETQVQ